MNYLSGLLMTMTDTSETISGDFSVDNLLTNLFSSMESWGKTLVMIVGIVMIVIGVVKIAQGMMSGGRGQVNWVLSLGLILIGGILAVSSGWTLITALGGGAKDTLTDLGTTTPGVIIQGIRHSICP